MRYSESADKVLTLLSFSYVQRVCGGAKYQAGSIYIILLSSWLSDWMIKRHEYCDFLYYRQNARLSMIYCITFLLVSN